MLSKKDAEQSPTPAIKGSSLVGGRQASRQMKPLCYQYRQYRATPGGESDSPGGGVGWLPRGGTLYAGHGKVARNPRQKKAGPRG